MNADAAPGIDDKPFGSERDSSLSAGLSAIRLVKGRMWMALGTSHTEVHSIAVTGPLRRKQPYAGFGRFRSSAGRSEVGEWNSPRGLRRAARAAALIAASGAGGNR